MYFGNYRRLVYLAQTDDPDLTDRARRAAAQLGLAFERRSTGLGELDLTLTALATSVSASAATSHAAAT
jgi:predicted component of type VI protein secretion system